MKKQIMSVITGLLFCSVAMAADSKAPVSGTSTVKTPAVATSEGTISALDQKAETFKLAGVAGSPVQVSYKGAEIMQAGKKADMSALKDGAKVKVRHISQNGMHIARSIEILPAK